MLTPWSLHLYDSNLSTPAYVEDLTHRVGNVQHSTRLHGGHWDMSFRIDASYEEFWRWFRDRLQYRVVMEDAPKRTAWEGRVEDMQWNDGGMTVGCYGYWHAFADRIPQLGSTLTYTAQNADVIVKDIRDAQVNGSIFSSYNGDIDSPGVALTVTYADIDGWRCLVNESNGAANFTDSSNNPWYVAVWDKQVVAFKARDISTVKWRVRLRDLARMPAINAPYNSISNAVAATYKVAGTDTRTTVNSDGPSQQSYGRRDLAVTGMGESNAASANARRDRALADRATRRAEITGGIELAHLYDLNGDEWPLCRIRAGDVLRIIDLVPTGANLSAATLDATRTFYVRETRCDHQSGICTVVPDTQDTSLPRLLANAGLLKRPTV